MAMIDNEDDKFKFNLLYNTYKQTMFYKAMEILKDEFLAEDAVHHSFIKIIKNLNKIDKVNCQKTKGFIVIITEHTSIDIYRKSAKEKIEIPYDEVEYFIEGLGPSVEEIYEENNENLIIDAITSLPTNYSTVLKLKYSHGYSNKEISQILSISEENVRQRIFRGKKKLEKVLEGLEEIKYEPV